MDFGFDGPLWIWGEGDNEENAVWNDDDDGGRHLNRQRREYKMHERIHVECWDDYDFIRRFRISKNSFAQVLQLVKPDLDYTQERSRYITSSVQLLIALRFYALGSMQFAVADFAGVSVASVRRILLRVSEAIARHRRTFVRMPETEAELRKASIDFYSLARFPRTIGAIDCTHIKIQSPGGEHAETYRNRKGWFSFNVQTVAAADLKIINIVARWPGSYK